MSQTRSDLDTTVHRTGRVFAHQAKWFPSTSYGVPPFQSEDQLTAINLAKTGSRYYKLRREQQEQQHEQNMEKLTNQFARLSINDVSVTDVFPLTR